ncbi:hypothetical protein HPB52_021082 [Rhipicephalus sanguineus]|uniref:Uncharacterized protein n=1 Tax=Rhipicephalus sanguineus TaxID=34632 RepID=A0A9D4PP06_RHISA|nr:hypothetical protein HPB52_021082 [Rhipicephalus sanguineus]
MGDAADIRRLRADPGANALRRYAYADYFKAFDAPALRAEDMDRQQGQPGDDGTSGDLNYPSEHGTGQAGGVRTENVAAEVPSPNGQRDAELGDLHAASGVTIPAGFRRRTVLRKAEQPSPSEGEGREAAALNSYIIHNGPNSPLYAHLTEAGFELPDTEAMLYLMHIQHSEFLRRLSLSLMPGIKKSCLFDALSLKTIVTDLRASIQAQMRNFCNAYQFYKSSQDSQIEPLEANVSFLLAEVKAELASSCSCLEEVSMLLDKKSAHKLPAESPALERPQPVASTGSVVVINEDDVPVIEDEKYEEISDYDVFEALLPDKADPGDFDGGDDCELPSQKEQGEASAVVFKELKSVLVLKAKEHCERERNALALSGVEGEDFDKLGFVVPEAELPSQKAQGEASAVVLKERKSVPVLKAKEHCERERNALALSGVEGEDFDKLGFVVPEAEVPAEDIHPESPPKRTFSAAGQHENSACPANSSYTYEEAEMFKSCSDSKSGPDEL